MHSITERKLIHTITSKTCRVMHISLCKARSKDRRRAIAEVRQMASYVVKMLRPDISHETIAGYFKLDRSTVSHSIRLMSGLIDTYPRYKRKSATVLKKVAGSFGEMENTN